MRTHLAIVDPRYAEMIASGEKTVEARLSVQRRVPFNAVDVGDVVYIKPRSRDVSLVACVWRVESFEGMAPVDVRRVRDEFNELICGEAAFWHAKQDARYATLVWLSDVAQVRVQPVLPSAGARRNAWCVLDEGVRAAA